MYFYYHHIEFHQMRVEYWGPHFFLCSCMDFSPDNVNETFGYLIMLPPLVISSTYNTMIVYFPTKVNIENDIHILF